MGNGEAPLRHFTLPLQDNRKGKVGGKARKSISERKVNVKNLYFDQGLLIHFCLSLAKSTPERFLLSSASVSFTRGAACLAVIRNRKESFLSLTRGGDTKQKRTVSHSQEVLPSQQRTKSKKQKQRTKNKEQRD